jgi:hypothetical protein
MRKLMIEFQWQWRAGPPATPVNVLVIIRTSEKKNNAQIDDRVSKAMAGRPACHAGQCLGYNKNF